jgi:hypothetical protein
MGLENRVLTGLQAERNCVAWHRRWWWSAATIAVMAIVVAVWLGDSGTRRTPTRSPSRSIAAHDEGTGASRQIPRRPAIDSAKEVPPHRLKKRANRAVMGAKPPKPDQFPSPQPLSEQEKILASYVMNYPEHAALVAQARAEILSQDREQERQKTASDSVP